jgi:hypothetical protein
MMEMREAFITADRLRCLKSWRQATYTAVGPVIILDLINYNRGFNVPSSWGSSPAPSTR